MDKNPKRNIPNKLNFYNKNHKDIENNLTKIGEKDLNYKIKNEEKNNIKLKGYKLKDIIKNEKSKEKNKIKKLNLSYTNVTFLLKLLFLVISISLTEEKKLILRKLNHYETEITITTNVGGEQYILYNNFYASPYEVIVNGIPQTEAKKKYNFESQDNNITLKFDTQLNNCELMFYNLKSITRIDLSQFDFSEVTTMKYMFKDCINLESVNFTNIKTSSVGNMEGIFYSCQKLLSLDLNEFNTSSVISMNNMFYDCNSLKSLDISNFQTSTVKSMESMFRNCKTLTSLDLSKLDTSNVLSMKAMFAYCENLKDLNIVGFETSKTTVMKYMFAGCTKITSLDLSGFNTQSVEEMEYMFSDCQSLKILKLDNFDGSSILYMHNMFSGCKELEYLNLTNFKTNTVQNMEYMFSGCEKLKELNLSNFETINVTSMQYMFNNCKQLKTLDISNFETSLVTNMEYMFHGCENLLSLDISNFNLSSSSRIDNMMSNLKSLIYLNLHSIIIGDKTKNTTDCLKGISSNLKYCVRDELSTLLFSFFNSSSQCEDICFENNAKILDGGNQECILNCKNSTDKNYEYNKVCYRNCPANTHKSANNEFLCERDLQCRNYYNLDKSQCFDEIEEGYYLKDIIQKKLDKCHADCKTCNKKETLDNTNCNSCNSGKYLNFGNCVTTCNYGNDTDEFGNNICKCNPKCKECSKESVKFDLCITCNDGYYKKIDDYQWFAFVNCYKNLEGYYLDNQIFRPCYGSCKTCDGEGNEENNNCNECKDGFEFKSDSGNNNCIKQTDYVQESDSTNERETDKLTEPETDNVEQSEIQRESDRNTDNEIVITVPKINETELIMNCGAEDLFIGKSCGTEISSPTNKDQLINNIQNDIMNRKIDSLLDNITKTKEDLVVQEKDTIYQITTTENQNTNEYKNISTVNLGDCEDRLKDIYKIDKSLPLIIFKIDYYSPDLLIPVIGYEIFHPVNKSKLDLNYCKDILVELNIPVSIDEDNLFKHDPNSEYYQDECVPSTSENGTDIILNDRQNEFNNNNLSLCQNNCTFTGYDPDTKKALCDCEVKTKINLISEIIEDKNILSSNFTSNDGSSSNVVTMKCVYTLFTKDGLKTNIGSYILIFVIVLFCVASILFYKVGYVMLENDIKAIIFEKEKENDINGNNNHDIYKYQQKSSQNKKKKKKSKNRNKKKGKLDFNEPPKKKTVTKTKSRKMNSSKGNDIFSQSDLKLKDVKVLFNFQKKKSRKVKISKNNKITVEKPIFINKSKINLNDYELNSLSYQEALKYDKRAYSQYYISLIKTKHPIIFSFIPVKDYNTMIVKICLFFLSFCIYYAVNALFFNDSTIHKIYEDGGSYNIVYFLPQIIYSFIISHFFSTVLKYIFVSERSIVEIKKEPLLEEAKNKVDKVKRGLIIKYITFFVTGILFLILFWYYLSSFCAVYKNSQVILIKNTFLSFLVSLLYPFIINILPGIFRIPSLGNNNDKELFYKISKFIQLL